MLQKPWFKMFIWFIASSFFLLLSAIVISDFGPGASEQQNMQYMAGMMKAMQSLMGLSMTIESDPQLRNLIVTSANLVIPLLLISATAALLLRILRKN